MNATPEGEGKGIDGWGLPLVALVAGLTAVPLLFATPMSAVLSLFLVPVAACAAVVVLLDRRPLPQTASAAAGGVVAVAAFLLMVLPYFLQD